MKITVIRNEENFNAPNGTPRATDSIVEFASRWEFARLDVISRRGRKCRRLVSVNATNGRLRTVIVNINKIYWAK